MAIPAFAGMTGLMTDTLSLFRHLCRADYGVR
jgi:hypothetical protein